MIRKLEKVLIAICFIFIAYAFLSFIEIWLNNLGGHNYGAWNIFRIIWGRG